MVLGWQLRANRDFFQVRDYCSVKSLVRTNVSRAHLPMRPIYHGHSITPLKLTNDCEVDPLYLVAIVNSTFVSWLAARTLSNFGKDVFPKLNPQDIKALLIPIVKTQSERRVHDELATLAQNMLDLQSDSRKARMALDKTAITRQIDAIDRQIDELVYQLYGLTKGEIAIVEAPAEPAAAAAQHA